MCLVFEGVYLVFGNIYLVFGIVFGICGLLLGILGCFVYGGVCLVRGGVYLVSIILFWAVTWVLRSLISFRAFCRARFFAVRSSVDFVRFLTVFSNWVILSV